MTFHLPNEIWEHIFLYLEGPSLYKSVAQTCSLWRNIKKNMPKTKDTLSQLDCLVLKSDFMEEHLFFYVGVTEDGLAKFEEVQIDGGDFLVGELTLILPGGHKYDIEEFDLDEHGDIKTSTVGPWRACRCNPDYRNVELVLSVSFEFLNSKWIRKEDFSTFAEESKKIEERRNSERLHEILRTQSCGTCSNQMAIRCKNKLCGKCCLATDCEGHRRDRHHRICIMSNRVGDSDVLH